MTFPMSDFESEHHVQRCTYRVYRDPTNKGGPKNESNSHLRHQIDLIDSSNQRVCSGSGSTPQEADAALVAALERVHQAQRSVLGIQTNDSLKELLSQWRHEVRFESSGTAMVMNSAYQRIIGHGPAALPFLFEELTRGPEWLDWALRAITGENPVSEDDAGDVVAATKAWLRWASENGYPGTNQKE